VKSRRNEGRQIRRIHVIIFSCVLTVRIHYRSSGAVSCDKSIPIGDATKTNTMSSGIMAIVLSTANKTSKVYTLCVSDIMLNSIHIVSRITDWTISLTPQITETASWYLNIQTWSTGMIVDIRSVVRDPNLALVHNGSRDLGSVVLVKGGSRCVTSAMGDGEQIAETATTTLVTACRDIWM
jgi:hypothetical protein